MRLKFFERDRYPHFLVIGTQKGGTTTLQKMLEKHPGVYLPSCKEVQYFSLYSEHPKKWYADHFKKAKLGQRIGEITPYYLFHPLAPKRIHQMLPKVRLIVLLREPVERTLSQVFHAKRHGYELLNINDALKAEKNRLSKGSQYSLQKHSYVARSRYVEQLERYEALFPSKQILILKSEDLFMKPQIAWTKIQKYLRIRQIPLPESIPHANAGQGETQKVDIRIRKELEKELMETKAEIARKYGIMWD